MLILQIWSIISVKLLQIQNLGLHAMTFGKLYYWAGLLQSSFCCSKSLVWLISFVLFPFLFVPFCCHQITSLFWEKVWICIGSSKSVHDTWWDQNLLFLCVHQPLAKEIISLGSCKCQLRLLLKSLKKQNLRNYFHAVLYGKWSNFVKSCFWVQLRWCSMIHSIGNIIMLPTRRSKFSWLAKSCNLHVIQCWQYHHHLFLLIWQLHLTKHHDVVHWLCHDVATNNSLWVRPP